MRARSPLLARTMAVVVAVSLMAACGDDGNDAGSGVTEPLATQAPPTIMASESTSSESMSSDGETTEPEPTEPETTEPEPTEPETTEAETTEPEPTEPETTEAESMTSAPTTSAPTTSAVSPGGPQSFSAILAEPASAAGGFTYDAAAAPVGATVEVTVTPVSGGAVFDLVVSGLQPSRGYAVHAHVNPCGATGDAAGPHYQDEVDPAATPEAPSVDPAYATPQNEVWLDLTTDASGAGTSTATVPFTFADNAPASIVLHSEMFTRTAAGEAGMAGDRLACIDAPIAIG
ncbi:MAG: hypothetical protein ACR2HP_02655 [Ilumatobacteraceae bacterium]